MFELSVEEINGETKKFLDCEPEAGREYKDCFYCPKFKPNPKKRVRR
jgi:hypothetical protein